MDEVSGVILDASALLAYLQRESGYEAVEVVLATGGVMSIVNYAEVLSRLEDNGEEPASVHRRLQEQGLIGGLVEVVPMTEEDAVTCARLRSVTRAKGLSLGDRACLATALRFNRPVITADRTWAGLDIGVGVRLIRG